MRKWAKYQDSWREKFMLHCFINVYEAVSDDVSQQIRDHYDATCH